MPSKRTAGQLKPNPKNPRKVTDAKLAMLKNAMARFGDLGGIVVNRRSGGQIVGGHQRQKVIPRDAEITIEHAYAKPTAAGTVAEGAVMLGGERFAYREVDWDEATEKAANIAANKGAGDFDMPQLSEWLDELQHADFDLDLTMFDADDRNMFERPSVAADDEWDEALEKVARGEQSGVREMAFMLSAEQVEVIKDRLQKMKDLGPFVDTGNSNSSGNALARLAELYHG